MNDDSKQASATAALPRASLPLWREPLLHFVLLGLLLTLVHRWLAPASEPVRDQRFDIEVPESILQEAHEQLLASLRREPSEQELDELIERYVGDEILYREATALGLHRDDPILRAQIIDKMLVYSTSLMPPTRDELERHIETQRDRFEEPERVGFEHVFFKKEHASAERDARSAKLSNGDARGAAGADDFPFGNRFTPRSRRDLSSLFGEEFAKRVFSLASGVWSDAIESRHGWHRVRVVERVPAKLPALDEVRQAALSDYERERRRAARRQTLSRLRNRYRVRLPEQYATLARLNEKP